MTQRYAMLILDAPMMSFGSEAVDSRRPTALFPGRSMLTGLVANALGWSRLDFNRMQKLQERVRYAAALSDSVLVMQDFQTAKLNKNDRMWTTSGQPEGRGGGSDSYNSPELRYLDYIVDAEVCVALRLENAEQYPTLDDIAHALRMPARSLHIGRKNCVPTGMIFQDFVVTDTATEALALHGQSGSQVQWDSEEFSSYVKQSREFWTSDLRDWSNRIHVGRRRVYSGQFI